MNSRWILVWAFLWTGLPPVCTPAQEGGQSAAPAGAAARIDSAVYQRVVDENIELRKERDRQSKDLVELRKRNATLLLQVQDIERRHDSLTAVLAEMKLPDETAAELTRLRNERAILLRDVERLQQAAGLIPANPPPLATPAPGSDLFRRLEKENADLRVQLSKARDSAQREVRSKESLAAGEKEIEAQRQALADKSAALAKDLEAARRNEQIMKAAIGRLARKIHTLKTETQTLRQDIAEREAAAKEKERFSARAAARTTEAARTSRAAGSGSVEEGLAAMQAGESKEAERLLLAALKTEPGNARAHYNLGVLYEDHFDNPGKAAFHYRKYLELKPDAPDASTVQSWLMELDLRAKW